MQNIGFKICTRPGYTVSWVWAQHGTILTRTRWLIVTSQCTAHVCFNLHSKTATVPHYAWPMASALPAAALDALALAHHTPPPQCTTGPFQPPRSVSLSF